MAPTHKACPPGSSPTMHDGRHACEFKEVERLYCYLDGTGAQSCYKQGNVPNFPPHFPQPPSPPPAPKPTPPPFSACGDIYAIKHENIVQNIKDLQTYEQQLFKLPRESYWDAWDGESSSSLAQRINELSEIRQRLFQELRNQYTASQCLLNNDRQDMADQIAMVSLVEKELDNAKANINQLRTARDNKLRMVEITNYEYDRYISHRDVFRVAAGAGCGVLLGVYLTTSGWGGTGKAVIIISVALFLYLTATNIYTNYFRNQWNWNQLEWNPPDPAEMGKGYETVWEYDVDHLWKLWHQAKSEYKTEKGKAESAWRHSALGTIADREYGKGAKWLHKHTGFMRHPYHNLPTWGGGKKKGGSESFSNFH